jgi:MYXO-CTERM domain-containing protein
MVLFPFSARSTRIADSRAHMPVRHGHASAWRRTFAALLSGAAMLAAPGLARADVYWVNWSSADVGSGTASGTITLPDNSTVTVTFAATTDDGGAGMLYGAQTGEQSDATDYWTPAATYESTDVPNAPPTTDILQLSGGDNETYTVTLSAPIVAPVMAIVSLGAGGEPCTYDFNVPFTIVSQGTDDWGGSDTALTALANNVLSGEEGSGTIQFQGTYSTFSWTVPTPETWHGFTFGIQTTLALDPDAGGWNPGSDAGLDDGGIEEDATAPDAVAPVLDATLEDAGVDATVASVDDAGAPDVVTTDVVTEDAGAAVDSGVVDSGVVDSGSPVSGADASIGALVAEAESSCGCRVPGGSDGTGGLALFGLGMVGATVLLRRRRANSR